MLQTPELRFQIVGTKPSRPFFLLSPMAGLFCRKCFPWKTARWSQLSRSLTRSFTIRESKGCFSKAHEGRTPYHPLGRPTFPFLVCSGLENARCPLRGVPAPRRRRALLPGRQRRLLRGCGGSQWKPEGAWPAGSRAATAGLAGERPGVGEGCVIVTAPGAPRVTPGRGCGGAGLAVGSELPESAPQVSWGLRGRVGCGPRDGYQRA